MVDFKRHLTRECAHALQELASGPDNNWWREVLADKNLFLAVRGGYLNVYVKGQSVFKIGPNVAGGKPHVGIHYKYLVEPKMKGNPYVPFDGVDFDVKPAEVVQTHYQLGKTLPRLVKTAAWYAGAEKEGIGRMAENEPKVVDVEIAFTRSGDTEKKPTAPRMDIAVLIPWGPMGTRLVFCEAKRADNPELWELAKRQSGEKEPPIAVVRQIETYEKFIGNTGNDKALVDAYVCVCKTLKELHEQGWKRKLDPLVESVATGASPLTIHRKVYLLVYGFDADQRGGKVKDRLAPLRAKDVLGHRVIAKGDPRSFRLSNDIRHCEAAARK